MHISGTKLHIFSHVCKRNAHKHAHKCKKGRENPYPITLSERKNRQTKQLHPFIFSSSRTSCGKVILMFIDSPSTTLIGTSGK